MQPANGRPLEGARILIAEDCAIQALDLKTLLEEAGAVVFGPTRTGTEVLALVASARITCAILDVMLRHEKVFQAARVLAWRGVGIVFHTGSGDVRELRREWPKAQVVTKSAPFELLLEAVMAASRENGLERKVKAAA